MKVCVCVWGYHVDLEYFSWTWHEIWFLFWLIRNDYPQAQILSAFAYFLPHKYSINSNEMLPHMQLEEYLIFFAYFFQRWYDHRLDYYLFICDSFICFLLCSEVKRDLWSPQQHFSKISFCKCLYFCYPFIFHCQPWCTGLSHETSIHVFRHYSTV